MSHPIIWGLLSFFWGMVLIILWFLFARREPPCPRCSYRPIDPTCTDEVGRKVCYSCWMYIWIDEPTNQRKLVRDKT